MVSMSSTASRYDYLSPTAALTAFWKLSYPHLEILTHTHAVSLHFSCSEGEGDIVFEPAPRVTEADRTNDIKLTSFSFLTHLSDRGPSLPFAAVI